MFIGIDIGGTKCAVILADGEGKIRKKLTFPTEDKNKTLDRIIASVKEMGQAEAIGVSCGGPLDTEAGFIMSPPNLHGWDRVPIVDIVEKTFGIPTYLCNDANAGALAEWYYGAGQGCDSMVFLTFGTGMGAGLVLNGRLYSGACGNAGEVGHIRMAEDGPIGYGKRGSFEGFCSGGGLARLGAERARILHAEGKVPSFCKSAEDIPKINAKMLAEHALEGDETAAEIFRICGYKLGEGLAVLIDILNPERIVIGSIYSRCGELLQTEMMKALKKECIEQSLGVCEIVPSALGERIGDMAALTVAVLGKEGKL